LVNRAGLTVIIAGITISSMLTFYDSGIGGLTILNEYTKLCKDEYRYFADIDFLPLGDKTAAEILERIKNVASISFDNSNLLVLACNTASVNSIRALQQNWLPLRFPDKQILSISKPITELLDSKPIEFKAQNLVILCTSATAKSGFYQCEFANIGYRNIQTVECPGLCDLIEKMIDTNINQSEFLDQETIKSVLDKINKPIDSNLKIELYLKELNLPTNSNILLACTHYLIIKNLIHKVYPDCDIVDPSEFIAKTLVDYIKRHNEYL
jgi:glutamate racemase